MVSSTDEGLPQGAVTSTVSYVVVVILKTGDGGRFRLRSPKYHFVVQPFRVGR